VPRAERHLPRLDIDAAAWQIPFSISLGTHHFPAIAKLRAARLLWAKLIKPFGPQYPKSLSLRTHSQTSG
jgi:methylmalonyl-CoA mutase